MIDVADAECVYGLGDRGKTYRAKTSYDVASFPLAGRQLHGHRNGSVSGDTVDAIRWTPQGPVVCLEAGASTGGFLRAAVLTPGIDTPELHEYADGVDTSRADFYAQMPWLRQRTDATTVRDTVSLLDRMRESEHVKVRPVEGFDDVVSANFTRQAFNEGAWDDVSVHARGLFMDEKTGEVLARGYEKFFHIGEGPGRTIEDWRDPTTTTYPVRAIKKYNGYLALVSSIHGRLAVFTKAGITDYSRVAYTMLKQALGIDGCEQLRLMLERTHTTAAFEVLRHDDPHPVTEPGSDRLVLLDAIRNTDVFSTYDSIAYGIAARFGFEHAGNHAVGVAREPAELDNLIHLAQGLSLEGVVLVDARGYRSKVKADGYTRRKSARGAIERFWRRTADTLGPRHRDLEKRLRETGLLTAIRDGRFNVQGISGQVRLDLAGIFDALDSAAPTPEPDTSEV